MELIAGLGCLSALATWWIHTFIGGRVILKPLQASEMKRFPKATMAVCWHATTYWLALVVVALFLACIQTGPLTREALLLGAFGVNFPVALIFMGVSKQTFGRYFALPQTFLLGPVALWAGLAYFMPVQVTLTTGIAVNLGLLLWVLAVLHLKWAMGSPWPSQSQSELVQLVVGHPPGSAFPSVKITLLVAFSLAMAGVSLILVAVLDVPQIWQKVLVWSLAGVFILRGLVGYLDKYFRPWIKSLPYGHWNQVLYSPLCLGMGLMALAMALAGS